MYISKLTTPIADNKNNNLKKSNTGKVKHNFKSLGTAGTQALNYLATNPAIGAILVDVGFMGAPRTAVDFSRGVDAGIETGTREFSSTLNHAAAGFVGLGAGYLLSHAINKSNGVKAHLMFINDEAIDLFSDFVDDTKNSASDYYRKFFENMKGLNGSQWRSLNQGTVEEATKLMSEMGEDSYKVKKDVMAKIKSLVTGDIGANCDIKVSRGEQSVYNSLENHVSNAVAIRKAYLDKAIHDAKEGVKAIPAAEFRSALKKTKGATALLGLGITSAIGMSLQPINMYLTKKRTGSDKFVGVDTPPDKSLKFKILKIVMALGIGTAMISTITKKPKEMLSLLQYKGIVPTINQFKLVYALTIMSRLVAARDKNELRESSIKDSLGFVNWLILGGFVSKLVSNAFDKDLINLDKNAAKMNKGNAISKGWKWITKAAEKTHDELIQPLLKKAGIAVVDEKGKIKPYRVLLDELYKKAPKDMEKDIKLLQKRIRQKNIAQLLGYAYSGIVLGWGIPKLNIAITKAVNKSKKNNEQQQAQLSQQHTPGTLLNQYNKTFGAFLKGM